jgi:hypothetical protein
MSKEEVDDFTSGQIVPRGVGMLRVVGNEQWIVPAESPLERRFEIKEGEILMLGYFLKSGRILTSWIWPLERQWDRKRDDDGVKIGAFPQEAQAVDGIFHVLPASLYTLRVPPFQDLAPEKGMIVRRNVLLQGSHAFHQAVCETGTLQKVSNSVAARGFHEWCLAAILTRRLCNQPAIGTDPRTQLIVDVIPAEPENNPIWMIPDAITRQEGHLLLGVVGWNTRVDRLSRDSCLVQPLIRASGHHFFVPDTESENNRVPQPEQAYVPGSGCPINEGAPKTSWINSHWPVGRESNLIRSETEDKVCVGSVSYLRIEPGSWFGKDQPRGNLTTDQS